MHALAKPDEGAVTDGSEGDRPRAPFRPIQYLGNKLRSVDQIAVAAKELIGATGTVADLFTGTSVVAQSFAIAGYRVAAVDTQKYAKTFADAMLGIERVAGESVPADLIIETATRIGHDPIFSRWNELALAESGVIEASDLQRLGDFYQTLPLPWRNRSHPDHIEVATGSGQEAFNRLPLIASVAAGSYFGVSQALAIDLLRHAIQALWHEGAISQWQQSAALTALMSAASSAVHSAGKHFAQPLTAGKSPNVAFLEKRLFDDRAVSVLGVFRDACGRIGLAAPGTDASHKAILGSAEDFVLSSLGADLYYADPPYTAQQYSRFYHLLESIVEYRAGGVVCNGEITSGLYPAQRYKSAFSSKRKAPGAFNKIARATFERGSALLISYSQSARDSTGNSRMISLPELLEQCAAIYGPGRVHLTELGHRYRQFNSASLSNRSREDPEVLISCERP